MKQYYFLKDLSTSTAFLLSLNTSEGKNRPMRQASRALPGITIIGTLSSMAFKACFTNFSTGYGGPARLVKKRLISGTQATLDKSLGFSLSNKGVSDLSQSSGEYYFYRRIISGRKFNAFYQDCRYIRESIVFRERTLEVSGSGAQPIDK